MVVTTVEIATVEVATVATIEIDSFTRSLSSAKVTVNYRVNGDPQTMVFTHRQLYELTQLTEQEEEVLAAVQKAVVDWNYG